MVAIRKIHTPRFDLSRPVLLELKQVSLPLTSQDIFHFNDVGKMSEGLESGIFHFPYHETALQSTYLLIVSAGT